LQGCLSAPCTLPVTLRSFWKSAISKDLPWLVYSTLRHRAEDNQTQPAPALPIAFCGSAGVDWIGSTRQISLLITVPCIGRIDRGQSRAANAGCHACVPGTVVIGLRDRSIAPAILNSLSSAAVSRSAVTGAARCCWKLYSRYADKTLTLDRGTVP